MLAPFAEVLLVEMTNRLVDVIGVVAPVVNVVVYCVHAVVMDGIIADA